MGKRRFAAVGMACTVALVLSACGNDNGGGGDNGGGATAQGTLDIGVVNQLSGPTAAGAAPLNQGIKARFATYEDDGGKCADALDFNIIEADDQGSPQGNVAAVQKLVQQDKVYAILQASPFFFAGIDFMTTQGADTPVVGYALDGPSPQWYEFDNNLFSAFQLPVPEDVYSPLGEFLSGKGATTVSGVSFNNASSQAGLENGLQSAEAAGIKRGYVNTTLQFGSTDVGPIVLGILDSGSDAVYLAITPDTALAIIGGLAQAGWEGTALLPTGYGPELLASEPARQAAQGVSFNIGSAPVETGNEAAVRESEAIAKETGEKAGPVGFYANVGWLSADLFLYGLEQAGCDASQQEFIDTLRKNQDYDAGGLLPAKVVFDSTDYPEACGYFLTLTGDKFVPDSNEPICGGLVSK